MRAASTRVPQRAKCAHEWRWRCRADRACQRATGSRQEHDARTWRRVSNGATPQGGRPPGDSGDRLRPPGNEWTPGHERQFARARAAATLIARLHAADGVTLVIDDVCVPEHFEDHYVDLSADPTVHRVMLKPTRVALEGRIRAPGVRGMSCCSRRERGVVLRATGAPRARRVDHHRFLSPVRPRDSGASTPVAHGLARLTHGCALICRYAAPEVLQVSDSGEASGRRGR